jgi:hypothetical protein
MGVAGQVVELLKLTENGEVDVRAEGCLTDLGAVGSSSLLFKPPLCKAADAFVLGFRFAEVSGTVQNI